MLPTAFLQRSESFEEAVPFFGPSDEPAEAFVVKGPFVDFAMRSTWAYAASEVVPGIFARAGAILRR